MKAVVAAFNQEKEKALVGAFSVITNLRMELFGALVDTGDTGEHNCECAAIVIIRSGIREARGGGDKITPIKRRPGFCH